jgi:hypothetical protein
MTVIYTINLKDYSFNKNEKVNDILNIKYGISSEIIDINYGISSEVVDIKNILKIAQPIDNYLHVICVISNPCNYERRNILAKEFICRMQEEPNIILYVCEMIYEELNDDFKITDPSNCNHLQLKTLVPLWHKENMINITIKNLLPPTWKAVAWIDADIEFESPTWALDTLKLLNGTFNAVQLFSHCADLDKFEEPMNIFQGFGYLYANKKDMNKAGINYPHPGYGWAYTRDLYDKMGSIYDLSILGSGDANMVFCLIANGMKSMHTNVTDGYKESLINFEKSIANNAVIGYIPGVIKHYFHGSKQNRRYVERWGTIINNNYDPYKHVAYDLRGILVPTSLFPKQLMIDILNYFKERNEDE